MPTPPEVCSFALGRGMYCTRPARHDGQHAPDRAPVNGHPYGTISWAEHVTAWRDYARRFSGQDALKIAVRGGFGLWELCDHLGRAPQTWEPGRDARQRDIDGMARVATAAPEELRQAVWSVEHPYAPR